MSILSTTIEIQSHGTAQGSLRVEFDRFDSWNGAPQYLYWIRDHTGAELAHGADLRLGGGKAPNDIAALEALISFLGAAAEAHAYELHGGRASDNRDLFPAAATEWAHALDDELSMAGEELRSAMGIDDE